MADSSPGDRHGGHVVRLGHLVMPENKEVCQKSINQSVMKRTTTTTTTCEWE